MLANCWLGGEPIVAKNLVAHLKQEGHDVIEDYYLPLHGNIKYIRALSGFFRTFSSSLDLSDGALKHYIHKIKEINPDIIITQYDYDTSIIEATKFCNKKIIVYVHIYWPICPKLTLVKKDGSICSGYSKNKCKTCILNDSGKLRFLYYPLHENTIKLKMNNRIERLNYENVTIITLNERMKELFISNGIKNDKIMVIENMVDSHLFKYNDKKENAICYLGGQNKLKGFETFLKIAEKLHENKVKVKIYATETFTNEIILQYDYINFLGHVDRHEVLQILQKCKCIIVPSRWEEPYGLVAVEGMLTGAIVIGSNLKNLENIIVNNDSGFIVDGNDAEAFVKRIMDILNDEHLFNEMSLKARVRAEQNANIERYYMEWDNLLKNIDKSDVK